MTSMFKDIEKNADANFIQQQTGSLSEITSEPDQAPEAQRHSLIHEGTAEMMRRGTHQQEALSQLRSQLQYFHHAQGLSEEFQQSQAELTLILERSNAAGVQLRNLCDETRIASASVVPEVSRLQAREAQLPTSASEVRNQETELQAQLLTLQQEIARPNDLMNQIRTASESMVNYKKPWM